MRPLRLELEGFTSFRNRTEIDFADTDLFVLAGAMGAGKSSIIDAMGFALYGAIARFHNLSLVAPVISQGLQEAKVRLVFRLGDAVYEATRIVRRNPRGAGATTPEARLTCGEQLIAETAEGVTREVTARLGLNFEQFNRCVVLPQGEFAELLHAKPSERQELLVRLLGITLYRRVGEAARERNKIASRLAGSLIHRLDNELATATEEAFQTQERRVALLTDLLARLETDEAELQALRNQATEHRRACQAAEQIMVALRAIKIPDGIKDFGERLRVAQAAVGAARKESREAAEALTELQEQRGKLPERALVLGLIEKHGAVSSQQAAVKTAEAVLAKTEARLTAAAKEVKAAETAVETAEAKSKALERAHSAYHAAQELKVGDTCPVCGEKLTVVPKLSEPAGLSQANNALKVAQNELRKAREGHESARVTGSRAEAELKRDHQRLDETTAALKDMPNADDCRLLLQEIDDVEGALTTARTRDRRAREAADVLDRDKSALEDEERRVWQVFNAARDSVAAHEAPSAVESVAESWEVLVAWAEDKAAQQEAVRDAARGQAESTLNRIEEMEQAQMDACAEAGVSSQGRSLHSTVVQAKATAEAELRHIDDRLAVRATVERDLEAQEEMSRVAGILGLHLNSTHFERWYLEEAMTRLVQGATTRLGELSDGQYSLGLNAGKTDFVVIDHINANEERPIRTLSGGETFLASLALALALGDDIANLAANGSARLDALFLDEGFGSLDANTLETVASAIEELGARGRMVGIITHVSELADRIPVQYRVVKTGGSSSVERVESR